MNAIAISIHHTPRGSHILSNQERPCPRCRRASSWWVNRWGTTVCVRCTEPDGPAPVSRDGGGAIHDPYACDGCDWHHHCSALPENICQIRQYKS